MSAPYSGGFAPGAGVFAMDGNFTQLTPISPPVIRTLLESDSILCQEKLAILTKSGGLFSYVLTPLGTAPNIAPVAADEENIILEQDFSIAQSEYIPLALNTPYDPSWSLGWQALMQTGGTYRATTNLGSLILVRKSELEKIGPGISRVRLTFASWPAPRFIPGKEYPYQFPGVDGVRAVGDFPALTVNYVMHEAFYVFDYLNILSSALIDSGGYRINQTTPQWGIGWSVGGLMIEEFSVFNVTPYRRVENASDDLGSGVPSIPSKTEYTGYIDGTADVDNGLPVRLAAQDSSFDRLIGNIWVRRTPFVIAR